MGRSSKPAALVAGYLIAALSACASGGHERTVYARLEREACEGPAPCLALRDPFGGAWTKAAAIEGFVPEEGYVYRLRVREADGKLTWVETVERTRVGPPDFKTQSGST